MSHISQCRTKTHGKGRVRQPTQYNSSNYKKEQKVLGVGGEVDKILDHCKASPNQRPVHNTVSYIIELITQHQKEQQQPQPLHGLFRNARIETLKCCPHKIARIRS